MIAPGRPLPSAAGVLLASGGAALLATALPLATYSFSLAAFGLAHVLVELRYVDGRFGDRVGGRLRWGLLALLAAVAGLRLARIGGLLDLDPGAPLELALVGLLVALVLPRLGALGWGLALPGLLALGLGAARAPIPTLLLLAVLHNWTPVGFVAEATSGRQRRAALGLCALVFGVVPALIASGLPQRALGEALVWEGSPLLPGSLAGHLGVWLPASLRSSDHAVALFSAATYAQVMHYAAVLHVLPRFEGRPAPGPLARAPAGAFMAATGALGLALFAAFAVDFGGARAAYGVVAAVHAWVELPLLLLALAPGDAR